MKSMHNVILLFIIPDNQSLHYGIQNIWKCTDPTKYLFFSFETNITNTEMASN